MKVVIATDPNGENIGIVKDYSNIREKGEITHFIAELELIKLDLLELWREWNGDV